MWIADGWKDYEVLDTIGGEKGGAGAGGEITPVPGGFSGKTRPRRCASGTGRGGGGGKKGGENPAAGRRKTDIITEAPRAAANGNFS